MADSILYYKFSNTDQSLTGNFSFNQAAAADQQVTTAEGLNIIANYNGQIYTQGNDNSAVIYTDELGVIRDQGLGLQFVIDNLFQISNENFIPANPASSIQTVTYTLNQAPTDLNLSAVYYDFSSADNTLTGEILFNQSDADDQQVTIAEGLKISVTYAGQTYTETLDSEASLLTNQSGDIGDQGLGLQFVIPDVFTINADNFIPANPASSIQPIAYTRFPGTKIDEDVAAGTSISTLSSTDLDANDTFTYSLVAGTGDTDNTAFTIDSNNLKINSSPDFETKSSYNIRVKTTDNGGLSFEKSLIITVNDLNEAPTDLSLGVTTVDENVPANTIIGTFSSTDQDANNTFTYSLLTGIGDTDNAAFTINGDKLQINSSPNFEIKSSYSIRVKTTDQSGLSFEKALNIGVNNTVIPAQLTKGYDDVFNIKGDNNKVTLKIAIASSTPNPNQLNELGVFNVDDPAGTVKDDAGKSLLPGANGYTKAALARAQVLFSTIANFPKFSANAIFAPFIIANADPSTYLSRGNSVYFSFLGANPSSDKQVDHIRLLGNNTFGFEDLASGGDQDFNDLIVRVKLS